MEPCNRRRVMYVIMAIAAIAVLVIAIVLVSSNSGVSSNNCDTKSEVCCPTKKAKSCWSGSTSDESELCDPEPCYTPGTTCDDPCDDDPCVDTPCTKKSNVGSCGSSGANDCDVKCDTPCGTADKCKTSSNGWVIWVLIAIAVVAVAVAVWYIAKRSKSGQDAVVSFTHYEPRTVASGGCEPGAECRIPAVVSSSVLSRTTSARLPDAASDASRLRMEIDELSK